MQALIRLYNLVARNAFILGLTTMACAGNALAAETVEAYPSKAIKIIVGFAPGGGSDFIARIVAKKLSDKLGQTVFVENKPGAGGNLGAEAALKAANDGYTLFLAAASYTVNANLYKFAFDPINDITPIGVLATGPFIISANPRTGLTKLSELVDFAKKNPGKLSYASAGSGSITHVGTEYFLSVAGLDMLHVPYKGTSPALTDTVTGQVQLVFGTVASTLPHVRAHALNALAVTTPARLAALPDVPTVAESGYPGFDVLVWHGLIGPKGIPKGIVNKLNQAIRESLNDAETATQFASDGLTVGSNTPEQFATLISTEFTRWGKLIKERNITLR